MACPTHNGIVKPGGWSTRQRADGRTEWIPPPDLDGGGARVNDYHHPERTLADSDVVIPLTWPDDPPGEVAPPDVKPPKMNPPDHDTG